jgi:four helix bundle protein
MPISSFHQRCVTLAGAVIRITQELPKTFEGRHIREQLFRSATSVGANAFEARSAESRADFIHKMQVALKEARETLYWLLVVQAANLVTTDALSSSLNECDELAAIMAKSVFTAQKNGSDTPQSTSGTEEAGAS